MHSSVVSVISGSGVSLEFYFYYYFVYLALYSKKWPFDFIFFANIESVYLNLNCLQAEALFCARMREIMQELEEFDPVAYVNDTIEKYVKFRRISFNIWLLIISVNIFLGQTKTLSQRWLQLDERNINIGLLLWV